MKNIKVLVCLILLIGITTAEATQTRVQTLGNARIAVLDEDNIFMYPQTLIKYPNISIFEITGATISRSGAHFEMMGWQNAGYILTDQWNSNYLPSELGTGIDHKLSMFMAKELGMGPFGLGLHLYGNAEKHDGAGDQMEQSAMGLKLDLGLTLMETLETYLSFGMLSWTDKDATGATNSEIEGGTTIALGGRWWMAKSASYTLIPYLNVIMMSDGRTGGAGDESISSTTIDLGIANNIMYNDQTTAYHEFGISMDNGTMDVAGTESDISDWVFPYFRFGLEYLMNEKFTFRFGGHKSWYSMTAPEGGVDVTRSGAMSGFNIGLGYHRKNLTLDADLDPGFFTRGPYLISGGAGSLASQVSLRVSW